MREREEKPEFRFPDHSTLNFLAAKHFARELEGARATLSPFELEGARALFKLFVKEKATRGVERFKAALDFIA